jgi:hypothetical protein
MAFVFSILNSWFARFAILNFAGMLVVHMKMMIQHPIG